MLSLKTVLYLCATIIMQREFWPQAIQVYKRAGLILYSLVDLQHIRVFLRLMEPCLHAHLRTVLLLQAQFLHSAHRHLKGQPSHLCR